MTSERTLPPYSKTAAWCRASAGVPTTCALVSTQRWPRYRTKTPVPRNARSLTIARSSVMATTACTHLMNSLIGAHPNAESSSATASSLSSPLPPPSSSPSCWVRCFFDGDGVAAAVDAASAGGRRH